MEGVGILNEVMPSQQDTLAHYYSNPSIAFLLDGSMIQVVVRSSRAVVILDSILRRERSFLLHVRNAFRIIHVP